MQKAGKIPCCRSVSKKSSWLKLMRGPIPVGTTRDNFTAFTAAWQKWDQGKVKTLVVGNCGAFSGTYLLILRQIPPQQHLSGFLLEPAERRCTLSRQVYARSAIAEQTTPAALSFIGAAVKFQVFLGQMSLCKEYTRIRNGKENRHYCLGFRAQGIYIYIWTYVGMEKEMATIMEKHSEKRIDNEFEATNYGVVLGIV